MGHIEPISGNLFGRIRRTATGVSSPSIVVRGYDGSYKAVRLDLTGLMDSANAELVDSTEAAVARTLGSEHRDQVTDQTGPPRTAVASLSSGEEREPMGEDYLMRSTRPLEEPSLQTA